MEEILQIMRENSKKLQDPAQIKILREVIEPAFKSIIENTQMMYVELENKIKREIIKEKQDYSVYTTILKRDELNYNSLYFQPIIEEDREERNLEETVKNIKNGETVYIENVFLQMDYRDIKELIDNKREFYANLCQNNEKCKIKIVFEYCHEYLKKEEELYHLFYKNNIKWSTLNNPYIRKMAKIKIAKVEGDITELDEITDIEYNFEEIKDKCILEYVPVWNVFEKIQSVTNGIDPAEDCINYSYNIFMEEFKGNSAILAYSEESEIKAVEKSESGELKIIADSDSINLWKLFIFKEITQSIIENSKQRIMCNSSQSIFNKFKKKNSTTIRTIAELKRVVEELGKKEGIELIDVLTGDNLSNEKVDSYEMNSYIKDEIRIRKESRGLVLKFKVEELNYTTIDMISYIVSEIQMEIQDFHCKGVIA